MNPDNIIFCSIRRSTELAHDIRAIVVGWEEAEVEEVVKRRQSQASCFCSTVDDAGMPRSWTDSHENSTVADIISFFSMGTLLKDCQKVHKLTSLVGKLHLETFLMNYAALPTLVTGEGETKMRKENDPKKATSPHVDAMPSYKC